MANDVQLEQGGKRRKGPARARILIVDDDERNLLALTEVLQPLAGVVTATSGREALRHLLKGDFAVILLDVFMPDMDGYETARLIRERVQTSRIPIIFLSAVNKETEHLRRGYAMGAVDYVFKPVDPLMLKSKVSVFVDLYKMRLQIEAKNRAEQQLREANLNAEIERLKIVRELEDSRARQASILAALPIALYEGVIDPSGQLRRRFVGGDPRSLVGAGDETGLLDDLDWESSIHDEDFERATGIHRDAELNSIEYRWAGVDGEIRHFLEQCVRADVDGEERWVGTLIDVTSQKRLEAQLVQAGKMDAIGQLTGGVAHDFNNLLAAVLGGLHVLQRRMEFSHREQRIVDQMRHAAEQGAELVRRMMAFARKQDLSPTSVNPNELCQLVAGLVEHTMGGTIAIEWQCADIDYNIFADKSQLELALLNLILNARDAMPQGGQLEVKIREHAAIENDAPGTYLAVEVNDQGSGIPPEHLNRITEPFFTTKEAGKGTGLGLSMVMGFAQQSGGRLEIDSSIGEGTRILLILPATPRGADRESEPVRQEETREIKVRSVLLVDDDDAVRNVLAEQLSEMGIEVESVADGASAVRLLANGGKFDFLLTDFAMPGLNGIETIKLATKEQPQLRSALMTGYADDESTNEAREFVTILRKPISMAQLEAVLS